MHKHTSHATLALTQTHTCRSMNSRSVRDVCLVVVSLFTMVHTKKKAQMTSFHWVKLSQLPGFFCVNMPTIYFCSHFIFSVFSAHNHLHYDGGRHRDLRWQIHISRANHIAFESLPLFFCQNKFNHFCQCSNLQQRDHK